MTLVRSAVVSLFLTIGLWAQAPAWRDASTATQFLGPDRFWRCRDTLLFSLYDKDGTGFELDVDVRDMNTYLEGPRPVLIWVTGPNGHSLARQVLPDDGVVNGSPEHHDGIPDMYGDLRYRAWHRHNSPGGYPPGKSRSPYLNHPGKLEARTVRLNIPSAGAGVYTLMIIGTWDNWISVTPDRPLPAAISPGPAPLYLHGDQLKDAWVYTPANTEDIGFAISEEVQPWSWSASILDEAGKQLGRIEPKGPYSYALLRGAAPDALYHLSVASGSPGACLLLRGAPMIICPDAETARLFHGRITIDTKGRTIRNPMQQVMFDWVDSLTPADLEVNVEPPKDPKRVFPAKQRMTLGNVATLLAAQQLDPSTENYGDFARFDDASLNKRVNPVWSPAADYLSAVAGWDDPENPYYGNPALIRRIMLYLVNVRFSTQASYGWYNDGDAPYTFKPEIDKIWQLPFRSNWYPLNDASFTTSLGPIREHLPVALPPAMNAAWTQSVRSWAIGRTVEQQGECTNQWAKGLVGLVKIWAATRDYEVEQVMKHQIDYLTTPGVLGRVNPDPSPWSQKSSVGYGMAADSGIIGAGIPSENFGHDGEYCHETVSHMCYIHSILPNPKIISWLNEYYILKTHLTMPEQGGWPRGTYLNTVSPTDSNFRTRYYTHKGALEGVEHEVNYGDLWNGEQNEERPWPELEKEPFVRSLDNRYHFVNTGAYYAILYTGPVVPYYFNWGQAKVGDGSVDWVGYSGMHYGGFGYKATKISAISGLWVPGCGPVISAQNHNVMYGMNVWARLQKPICEEWEEGDVDATIVAEGMDQPDASFDGATKTLTRETVMHYIPLTVRRVATFGDNEITMNVEIEATNDMELVEAYEAVPVFTENRKVALYDGAFKPVMYTLPEAITTLAKADKEAGLPEDQRGPMPDAPEVTARVIDIAGESGAGAAYIFDEAHTFTQTQPIRYRDVAAATGGFNLKLPTTWKRGQIVKLRYRIVPHQEALQGSDLK